MVECNGGCNILDDLSDRICIPKKVEDVNVHLFNLITGINE